MLQTIKRLLAKIINDIDTGNSNISEEEQFQIIEAIRAFVRKDTPMSKYQAYTYLGISRATFDNMVRAGKIPKGKKVPGFKELQWFERDLSKLK